MDGADFVIVGAGSAGCVLAARLSEDARHRVTLLEAGGETVSEAVNQPNQWPTLFDTAENWGYLTTQQRGFGGRAIPYPRGKGLGGTSAINAMMYIRGEPRDFDGWRDAGNPGWGWSDVLPYFLKSEDQQRGAGPLHGTGGPLPVSDPASPHAASLAFIDAAAACGHRRVVDFNGETRAGAGVYQTTTRGGVRASTAATFLAAAQGRPNLRVVTGARVLRVVFEGDRATAVDFFDGREVRRVHAREEVILSAGAIDSPRLLMLSGVGAPAQLEKLGIPVRHALPGVGENLCDHPMAGIALALDRPGPIPAESILAEAGLFMKSATVDDGFDTHLQFFFIPRGPMLAAALGRPWGMFLSAQACRPRSRGRVRLRSADAADVPLIDPAFLSDPHDMQLQIEGLREARRIAASEPLKALWRAELSPGLAAQSDADLDVAIRMNAGTVWHPVGTCRMGPGADAVVDAQLRVHGLRGLRVVDASVMPQITSGNTNAPTIMIAEKAAEMIVAG